MNECGAFVPKMKIAIAGKGGSGKTTIAGILTRLLAERGQDVWAIDADSNPNFGVTLGLPPEKLKAAKPMPPSILKEVAVEGGKTAMQLAMPARRVAEDFGTRVSDRVTLLGMHTIEHAGAGCACGGHARVRNLLSGIFKEENVTTVVDMEAGLEHLSRGTDRHVDLLLLVTEPYFKALETARRAAELARELRIPRIAAVANKFRSEDDLRAIREYAQKHGLELVGEIPYDEEIQRADLAAEPPKLYDDHAAVAAVRRLIDRLKI
ncbi:MAG TPA: AAA family ATPase [Chthoniobacterales bacterium]|nr:AAA family ATPase [Chthoniobacterales bacterium]